MRKNNNLIFKRKYFLLFIITIIVLPLFLSCGDTGTSKENDTTASGTVAESKSEQSSEESSEFSIFDNLPQSDYGGYEFKVLTFPNQVWSWAEILAEEETGEIINDAFYARNRLVEEKLNINIRQITADVDSVPGLFQKSVRTGDNAYDVAFMRQQAAANTATGGFCLDLNELKYTDYTQPWWDKNAFRDLSFANKNYIAASEITVGDKEAIWIIYFDKKMIADNGLESPYALVDSGKWTFDKMLEMMESVETDLNNDGKMNKEDVFGLLTHGENFPALWIAGGCRLVENDENNIPQIAFNNQKFFSVWEKLSTLMSSTSCYTQDIGFISSGLANGQTLFATEVLCFIRNYRENERDFGVVPMPKYDESQEEYQTYVALGTTLMAVANNIPDTERTGIILESLAAEGYKTILPAYYEKSIKSKYARDEESIPMLDIAFNTRRYDLGLVYNWGKVSDGLRNTKVQIASFAEQKTGAMEAAMRKTFDMFNIY